MGNKQNKGTANYAHAEPENAVREDEPVPGLEEDNNEIPNKTAGGLPQNSSKIEPNRRYSARTKGQKTPVIPRDKFEKFLRCLKEFPFDVNEDDFKDIAENLEVVKFNKNDIILTKGEDGKGVYLVVDGFCIVYTVSGDALRYVDDEDFFGEVSSFYNRPCSATVVCGKDRTELLLLPKAAIQRFIRGSVDLPVLKWFVKRRYLDIEGTSIQKDIVREMVTEACRNVPLFHEWSADAINCVVRSVIDDQSIVFYFAGSDIFTSGEVDTNGFLLLQGDIEVLSGYQQSLEILSAGANGLWFGDEQLFCGTEREISVKAHSPCIIAIFNRGHFQKIEESFPTENAKLMNLSLRWKRLIENRDKKLHEKYAGQLGIEMTRLVLRKSRLFPLVPQGMIYYLAISVTHRQIQKDELVFAENEKHDKMFLVFTGAVTVESHTTVSTKRLEVSDIYYPTEDEPKDIIIRASEESIIGMFAVKSFKEAHDLYPEGIIVWGNVA